VNELRQDGYYILDQYGAVVAIKPSSMHASEWFKRAAYIVYAHNKYERLVAAFEAPNAIEAQKVEKHVRYHVKFETDVVATGPEDAAKKAWAKLHDNHQPICGVHNPDGHDYVVLSIPDEGG